MIIYRNRRRLYVDRDESGAAALGNNVLAGVCSKEYNLFNLLYDMRRLCVRRFTFLVVLIIVLLAGGGLTSLLVASGGQVLPVLQQVSAPDASPTTLLPWKANQFFIFIAFVLFNLVGIAVTLGDHVCG